MSSGSTTSTWSGHRAREQRARAGYGAVTLISANRRCARASSGTRSGRARAHASAGHGSRRSGDRAGRGSSPDRGPGPAPRRRRGPPGPTTWRTASAITCGARALQVDEPRGPAAERLVEGLEQRAASAEPRRRDAALLGHLVGRQRQLRPPGRRRKDRSRSTSSDHEVHHVGRLLGHVADSCTCAAGGAARCRRPCRPWRCGTRSGSRSARSRSPSSRPRARRCGRRPCPGADRAARGRRGWRRHGLEDAPRAPRRPARRARSSGSKTSLRLTRLSGGRHVRRDLVEHARSAGSAARCCRRGTPCRNAPHQLPRDAREGELEGRVLDTPYGVRRRKVSGPMFWRCRSVISSASIDAGRVAGARGRDGVVIGPLRTQLRSRTTGAANRGRTRTSPLGGVAYSGRPSRREQRQRAAQPPTLSNGLHPGLCAAVESEANPSPSRAKFFPF